MFADVYESTVWLWPCQRWTYPVQRSRPWNSKRVTLFTLSIRRIQTGGKERWTTPAQTSQDSSLLQNFRNGTIWPFSMFYDRLTLFEITGVHVRSPCLSQVKRFISFRRVASKSKSTREAGQSCSPFGKKKKCKDKYLAKHSSSKYLFSMILYHMQCIFSLRKSSNNSLLENLLFLWLSGRALR